MATDKVLADVLAKIEKIRALADRGGTQHEAEVAAEKMAALLMRYNLSMATIDEYVERTGRRVVDHNFNTNGRVWRQALMHVIAEAHMCQAISHDGVVTVIGHDHNMIVVRETWYWLLDECKRLADLTYKQAKQNGDRMAIALPRHWKNDFHNGFSEGIAGAYRRMREAMESDIAGSAIVPVMEQDVTAHVRELFPNSKVKSKRMRMTAGYLAGREAGESVNLARQLSGRHHESVPTTLKG